MNNEFKKYAVKHLGMNSSRLDSYINITSQGYISPTIIEERQLNVAQMDVFSRLMMDRIIFLGTAIDDYTANVIQAQLLYLDSPTGKNISIYQLWAVRYRLVFMTPCSLYRARFQPSVQGLPPLWQLFYWWPVPRRSGRAHAQPGDDSPTAGRSARTGVRY